MSVEVLLGELITGEDMEAVAVDLDVAINGKICRGDEFHVLVYILVFAALKELAFYDA